MLEELLLQNESKTFEIKENISSPIKIIKTIVAFANTAGGIVLIGVEDETKRIVGIKQVLLEEERISNLISDSISPMLIPDIDIVSHQNKELMLVHVPHLAGPYYLKNAGIEKGTFIRVGSSNRLADPETLANLHRLAKRISFDEMPCISASVSELDSKLIFEKLHKKFKNLSSKYYESLGLVAIQNKKKFTTYAGLLLFSKNKSKWLPDSIIKCVCFSSLTKKDIIDKREININLIDAVDEAIIFIQRNTKVAAKIGAIKRIDIPEYPSEAVREAVINAIVHTDYSIKGSSIQISIFSDRIEIINPGNLTFGQTMDSALSGISKMRNPIIGRIFREIGMIETLGIGMQTILHSYENMPAKQPHFEEIDHFFKVTLFSRSMKQTIDDPWAKELQDLLSTDKEIRTSEIAKIWGISDRAARARLNKMLAAGYIKRNAKSKNDPGATYSLVNF